MFKRFFDGLKGKDSVFKKGELSGSTTTGEVIKETENFSQSLKTQTTVEVTGVLDGSQSDEHNPITTIVETKASGVDSVPVLNKKSYIPMDSQARDIFLHHIQERHCSGVELQGKKISFPKGTVWKTAYNLDSVLLEGMRQGKGKISEYSSGKITFGKLSLMLNFSAYGSSIEIAFQENSVNDSDIRDGIQFLETIVFPKIQLINSVQSEKDAALILNIQPDELFGLNNDENTYVTVFPFTFSQGHLESIILDELFSLFGSGGYNGPEVVYNFSAERYSISDTPFFSVYFNYLKVGTGFTLRFCSSSHTSKDLKISFDANGAASTKENLQKIIGKLFARLRVEGTRNSKNASISALDKLRATGIKVSMPDKDVIGDLNALRKKYGFIGRDELFEQLQQDIIDPLKNPEKYLKYQKRFEHASLIPNAALMYGPPGNGKTTFAQILGNYIGCPFVYIPVATMFTKWQGETENNFNTAFVEAGNLAKEYGRVIVMIDEIDEVGADRNRDQSSHGTQQKVTGIILKKLEGFEQVPNMFFFGATNRKDVLDPALLSRFQTQIEFTDPNPMDAKKILGHYLDCDLSLLSDNLFEGISSRDLRGFGNSFLRFCAQSDMDIDTLQGEVLLQLVITRLQVARRLVG